MRFELDREKAASNLKKHGVTFDEAVTIFLIRSRQRLMIPEKGLQLARYYGYYSNKARGQRRLQDMAALTPMPASCPEAPPNDDFPRFCRRAWARLIRKVYLVDPLTCPKCGGRLRILSFIDNPCVIEKILRHLKIWDPPERPPPPRRSTTLEPDADFLDWEATARQFDAID